jgi:hypothetical protein
MPSQIKELFDDVKTGRWILSSADHPNPISLVLGIAAICGATGIPADLIADQFRDLVG